MPSKHIFANSLFPSVFINASGIFFGLHGIQTHIFTSSHAKFYVYVFYKGGLRSMSCRTNHHLVIPQSQGLGYLNYFLYTDIETVNASYDLP
jgi:hypothetical protein